MKHTIGYLLRAVLILLCYTVKRIRIPVNLRFVKVVFIIFPGIPVTSAVISMPLQQLPLDHVLSILCK